MLLKLITILITNFVTLITFLNSYIIYWIEYKLSNYYTG